MLRRPKTLFNRLVLWAFALSVCVAFIPSTLSAPVQIETLRTLSRLSFNIDPSATVELKSHSGNRFSLFFSGTSRQDLGFSEAALKTIQDQRLKSLKADETDSGVLLEGEWIFPKGKEQLAKPEMETFLYHDQKQGRWIFDFWTKSGATLSQANSKKAETNLRETIRRSEELAAKRIKLQKEEDAEMAQQENVGKFCEEPLKEGVDVFLPFYPLHERVDIGKYLPTRAPDAGYPYLEPISDNEDAKYYKLALSLYKKEKFALALRSLDFHAENVKKSEFKKDLDFLRANVLWKLLLKEKANQLFVQVKDNNLGHPSSFYAGIHLANQAREESNALKAYEIYSWLAQNYPQHEEAWVFRLAAAETLYEMKQTDRAEQEFSWLSENAPTPEARAMASVRIGNVFVYRRQYDKAIAAYFKSQKDFPNEAAKSPFLQINRGESLYWLGELDKSREAFSDFLKTFPSHPAGWRALLRIAEIEGRRAEGKGLKKMRELLLETVNRYPLSPGATLARMRLIPCGDHAGYTVDTAETFFNTDVEKFDGKGEFFLAGFEEMRATLLVKSFVQFGYMDRALDAALNEADTISQKSLAFRWLTQMQRKLFRKNILALLEQKKNYEAAKFFDDRIDRMKLEIPSEDEEDLAKEEVINPRYLLRLSRVVSDLGLGSLAKKIYGHYEKAQTQYEVSRFNTILLYQQLGLEERKKSEKNYTLAKALWVENRVKNEKKIREHLAKVREDSPYSFQKAVILGLIEEQSNRTQSAIQEVQKAKLLLSKAKETNLLESGLLDQWMVQLQLKSSAKFAALDGIDAILQNYPKDLEAYSSLLNLGVAQLNSPEELIQQKAEIYASLNRWGDVAKAYEDLYAKAAQTDGVTNRVKVELARALIKSGKQSEKAKKLLEEVASSKEEDFWKELARKSLVSLTAKEGVQP
jgi:TolA-binding protein